MTSLGWEARSSGAQETNDRAVNLNRRRRNPISKAAKYAFLVLAAFSLCLVINFYVYQSITMGGQKFGIYLVVCDDSGAWITWME